MKPYLISPDAEPVQWKATTLRALGHDEAFLERIVAAKPDMLGLDPYETGVGLRVVAFRQKPLITPTGRTVIPDVVLLSESGHIVVVEVKLADNPELKDRRVLAQVIEYAASIANLSDDDLLDWLQAAAGESWLGFVHRTFPQAEAPDRLAATLRRRMRDAELHLVIVCDGAPEGLRDFVAAVAGQAALGAFKLHVVELTPYVTNNVQGVLLVPATTVQTEIIGRTAITVSYGDAPQPTVSVVASSAEEVAEAINEVRASRSMRPEFAAIIHRYDSLAADDLRTIGRSAAYKQVHPPEWPRGIHYEFYDKSGGSENVGIELHVESPTLGHVSPGLGPLAQKIGALHDPNWKRLGRIFLRVPVADTAGAAEAMQRLIQQTRSEVTTLLKARP